MKRLYLFPVFAAVLFASCKSASKSYERGNFSEAIALSLKKLQKNPDDYDSRTVLKKAYTYGVSQYEDQIRILLNSNSDTKYDQAYRQYMELQNLYTTIRQYPTAAQYVKPADYSNLVETYSDKAANAHLEKAVGWLQENDRLAYRKAYQEFANALRYKPNDINIQKQAQASYEAALVKVLVVPMNASGSNYYTDGSSQTRSYQDGLVRSFNYTNRNNFIQFYTSWDTQNNKVAPDEILEMRMGRIYFGQPSDQQTSKQTSKDVVVKETVYSKDSVAKEYAKLVANVTTTHRTIVSNADMYVTARDTKGKTLWTDDIAGEHQWQADYATYTGDERALSDADKKLINKKINAPQQEEIVNALLKQIENNLSARLSNYYSNYK